MSERLDTPKPLANATPAETAGEKQSAAASPAPANTAVPMIDGMTIPEFVKASAEKLRRSMTAAPGGGAGTAAYLKFNGNTGQWALNRDEIDPVGIGHLVVLRTSLFEGVVEWAGGRPLQKAKRPLFDFEHKEPMTAALLPNSPTPSAYHAGSNDGPKVMLGFTCRRLGCEGAQISYENWSGGALKAVLTLANEITYAIAAFREGVNPVVELTSRSYENSGGKLVFEPIFNVVGFVGDSSLDAVETLSDADIMTQPPHGSRPNDV